jgi:hypothetical protein
VQIWCRTHGRPEWRWVAVEHIPKRGRRRLLRQIKLKLA